MLLALFTIITLAISSKLAHAQEDLVYVAVEPCRIADTRNSSEGVIQADTVRNFLIAGTAGELGVQGGIVGCPNPRTEKPVAAAIYIIAARTNNSGNGNLFAFPSDTQPGQGSTVNFRGGQNIGNTTIVNLCTADNCPSGGELGIVSNFSEQHAIIDVQGYFYPLEKPTIQIASKRKTGTQSNDGLDVECPDGTQIISGGGFALGGTWLTDSYPVKAVSDTEAWTARFSGATGNELTSIAVCVSGFNPTIVLPREDEN